MSCPTTPYGNTPAKAAPPPFFPREEAQNYTLLYRFRARLFDTYKQLFDAHYAVIASGLRFSSGHNPQPDFSRMTPAQLDEFSAAFSKEATALNTNIVFCGFMAGAQRALLDGATSEAEIVRVMTDSRNPYRGWSQFSSASSVQATPADHSATH